MKMLHTKQAVVLMAACICWQTDSFGKIIVTEKTFHLGTKGLPEWNEFAGKDPHSRNLSLDFEGKPFKGASTLFIKQDDARLARIAQRQTPGKPGTLRTQDAPFAQSA